MTIQELKLEIENAKLKQAIITAIKIEQNSTGNTCIEDTLNLALAKENTNLQIEYYLEKPIIVKTTK